MSKAFTRESESGAEEPMTQRAAFTLPPGVKNYLTPGGAERLREELAGLVEIERNRATASSDRRHEPGSVNHRILYLQESLQVAEIVQPPANSDGTVRFGATIVVRDKSGAISKYRIVGIDEMDLDRDWVSWRSPVARALLNKKVGDKVRFSVPEGERQLEIVAVTFDEY